MQTTITQPPVLAPLNISATVIPYHLDQRITFVEFQNHGNTAAPKRLSRAVLVPEGITPPQVLQMSPNQQLYIVPADGEVSCITVTVGRLTGTEVLVLAAVIDITSMYGDIRHQHACANFD